MFSGTLKDGTVDQDGASAFVFFFDKKALGCPKTKGGAFLFLLQVPRDSAEYCKPSA